MTFPEGFGVTKKVVERMGEMVKKIKKQIHIVVADAGWKRLRGCRSRLEKVVGVVLMGLPAGLVPLAGRAEVTLLLTSDGEVRRLNREFRGIDKPTNVLSFPQFTRRQLLGMKKGRGAIYIGDIAIAYRFTAREARQDNKSLDQHLRHLLIHGLLHLFGYDHGSPVPAARMERLEKKLMAELGLPDPYAEAARTRRRA